MIAIALVMMVIVAAKVEFHGGGSDGSRVLLLRHYIATASNWINTNWSIKIEYFRHQTLYSDCRLFDQ